MICVNKRALRDGFFQHGLENASRGRYAAAHPAVLDKREKKIAANRELKLLSTLYRHAINWGLCGTNPCASAFYHPEPGRDRYITDAEFERLKAKSDPMMRAVVEFACLVGARRQDILKLERKDITDDGVYICQGKTGKRQLFYMTPELDRVIKSAKRVNRKAEEPEISIHQQKGAADHREGFQLRLAPIARSCRPG